MKRNLLLLIVLCCTMSMLAQNGKISYQAVVRDSENHLVYDTPLQVTVSLANSETGTAVYSEQHAVTSNANGLISLLIGDGQNKQGHWEDVQWNTAWVTATIRKASDQTFLAEHHLPLSAVPYALYADFADSVNLAVLQDYLDEHHYVTEDELPAVQANADWTETNPDTASYIKNKPDLNDYEKKSELCGDVKDCIKDTLGKYTTTNQIDTLLGAYYDTTHTKSVISDTATALRAMMGDAAYNSKITLKKNNVELDSFRLNQQTDKAINIPVPTTVAELSDASNYVTKTKLNDTLGAYYDTANVKQMLKPYLKANELCDSIVKCDVIKDMRDSIRNNAAAIQTNANNIGLNQQAIIDSSAHIRKEIKYGQITIALNRGSETGVTNPTFGVNQADTQTVTINIPEATTVNNGQLTIVAAGDTTRFTANQATNDTMRLNKFATKDTLAYYATTSALKDSLSHYVGKEMLNDTLSHYTTTNQLDTVIRKYGYVTNAHLNDTLAAVYNTIRTDSTALHKAIKDTAAAIRGDICDSATACITKALADPTSEINHAIDTIARYNIHDTAQAIRSLIPTVPTAVSAFVNDVPYLTEHQSLEGYVTTVQMDNRHYLTSDSTVITTLATRIHDDSVTLATRMDTVYKHLCDSIEQKCTNVALKSANNSFVGKNHFADSVTVPSNTSIPRPATAEHSCTDNVASAVNICDLLAVFDSLTNRIKKLEDEVNALKSAVPPVFNSLTLSDSTATTMKVTTAFTSTGIPISEYQYCYSKNSDMSAPSCTTSTSNSITLTGLDPYTRYYVTVSAVNVAGTTTSVIKNARTLAYAPTATTVNVAEHKPTGFQVDVSGLDFKEPAVSGTVQICYKQKGSAECAVDPTNTYSDYVTCETPQNATNSSDITKIINNIELSQNYCVIVKVSNADSTTIYGPFSVTPANVTLTVTGTPSVTYHCGSPDVDPQYTATLSTGESADDYTFSWTGGTAASNNQTTYNPTLSETTTVTCTATHKTLNYELSGSVTTTVTIASVLPVISLCTEELTVTDKGSSNDISSVDWGDGNGFISATTVGHTYSTDGVYTITAKNAANCETTRQVVLGKVTVQPCTVSSTHVAQNLISGNDGKETVDANGKVVKVMDYDGHSYSVVQIGNQCWMAENLRTTHYGDGTAITQGSVASSAARYYIPKDGNNQNLNDSVFGLLYNWYAATRINNANDGLSEGKQGVCPQGWHVPTQSDWITMETFVNGGTPLDHTIGNLSGNIAGKLAKGCAWTSSETEKASGNFAYSDRNAIGLGIVPAGRFNKNDTYTNYGSMAEFWVSYGGVNANPYSWDITSNSSGTRLDDSNESEYKQYALSVRCVRDETCNPISVTFINNNENVSTCPEAATEVSYTALIKEGSNDITNNYNYSWSVTTLNNAPTDGASLSSSESPTCTVTFSKEGSYQVSYTATPKSGSGNLESSTISTVTYKLIPSFVVQNVSGRTVTLSNLDVDKITWSTGGNEENFTGATSASHKYDENGTYTITATKTNGCSATTEVTVSLTLGITSEGDTSFCIEGNINTNTVITYTAAVNDNGTTPASGYEYTWSLSSTEGAALSSTSGATVTVTYSAVNAYTVYCTASATTGDAQNSVKAAITSATPSFNTPNINGGAVTLDNLTNTNQIIWDNNNPNTTTISYQGYPSSATYTYSTPGTHPYTIVTTNTTRNCTKQVNVEVTVPQVATLSPTTQDISICPDQTQDITYTAQILNGTTDVTNEYTYEWSVTPSSVSPADGATLPSTTPTGKTCTVTFSKAGSYTVSYTARKSGSDDLPAAATTATVNYKPIPSFDNPTVSGHTVTLNNLQNVDKIQWTTNGSEENITTTTAPHKYDGNGTYTITATKTEGCTTTTDVTVSLTLGITSEGSTTICTDSNTVVTYTAAVNDNGTTPSSGYDYSWSLSSTDGAALSSNTGTTVSVTYSASATYTVSCTASATTGDASHSVQTSITELTTPNFNTPPTIAGATVTLTGLTNTNQIIWDTANASTTTTNLEIDPNPTSASHSYTEPGEQHTYTIVAKNTNTNCIKEIEVTVSGASMSITAEGNTKICNNNVSNYGLGIASAMTYTATITNAEPTGYVWSVSSVNNNTPTLIPQGNSCVVLYSTTGTYTVSCTATGTGLSKTKETVITLNSNNTPNNTVSQFAACVDEHTVELKSLTQDGLTIYWGDGGKMIVESSSSTPLPSHEYTTDGEYTIAVNYIYNSTYNGTTNCTSTKTLSIYSETPTSCSASSWFSNESVSGGHLVSVTDVDNNEYAVVEINGKCWMAENMRATHYANGDAIITVSNTNAATYNPGNDPNNVAQYGLLYNWYAATRNQSGSNVQGICPNGWHIPTNDEWNSIKSNTTKADELAKSCNWKFYSNAPTGAPGNYYHYENRNSTGFSALPAGVYKNNNNSYTTYSVGSSSAFWCSAYDKALLLEHSLSTISNTDNNFAQADGLSVRCVRDSRNFHLSITSNPAYPSTCNGNDVEVVYTASVLDENDNPISGFDFEWELPTGVTGESVTNGYQVTLPGQGDYTISCSATPIGGGGSIENSKETTVSACNPSFSVCQDGLKVTLRDALNIAFIKWSENDSWHQADNLTHEYSSVGTYQITAKSASESTASETVTVSNSLTPCTITASSKKDWETLASNTTDQIVSVTDIDGNTYPVVKIGNQCWMAENLRVTHFQNGNTDPITLVTTTNAYTSTSCRYYPGGDANNLTTYGYLYNWKAAMNGSTTASAQGVCPTGWHVPSFAEWTTLINEIGDIAGKLAGGCQVWQNDNNTNAPGNYDYPYRNSTGFSALPTGCFHVYSYTESSGVYVNGYSGQTPVVNNIGETTRFWTSTKNGDNFAFTRYLLYNDNQIRYNSTTKQSALPVRCVRD